MNLLQSGVASAERVFALLDAEEEEPDCPQPAQLLDPDGRVDLESVGFQYEPGQPLIADFSLSVSPGQTVAIVGPDRCGQDDDSQPSHAFLRMDSGRLRSTASTG